MLSLRQRFLALGLLAFGLLTGACSQTRERRTLRSDSGQSSKISKGNQGGADAENEKDLGKGKTGDGKDDKGESESPTDDKDPELPADSGADDTPITGIPCAKSSVYQKTSYCESTVDGISVKWVPLENDEKPSRIALYLHGDTANDWREPFVVSSFISWARKNKVMIVMSLATARYDGDAANEWSYGAAQAEDAEKLAKMLQSFVTAYKVPADKLLYFGVSGGPWFLSSSWIPMMAGKFPGLYALSCGGSQFWRRFAWDVKDTALRDKVKIFYNFGDKDFLAEYQEASYQHYREAGIETTKKVHAGATHCSHDIYGPTIAFWETHMR